MTEMIENSVFFIFFKSINPSASMDMGMLQFAVIELSFKFLMMIYVFVQRTLLSYWLHFLF